MRHSMKSRAGRAAALLLGAAMILAPMNEAEARVVGHGAASATTQQSAAAGTQTGNTQVTSSSAATETGTVVDTSAVSAAGTSAASTSETSASSAAGTSAVSAAGTSTVSTSGTSAVSTAATSDTGGIVEATAPSGAAATSNTLAEPRVVTSTLFDGGELMMLSPDSTSQMEAFLITTKSGKLIVVDGGTESETEHLKQAILKKGGHVSAWLITHPHSDHVGAMTKILNDPSSGITIDGVYYHYLPIEWYQANEAYRADMVSQNLAALSTLSPSVNHPNIQKGDVITVDDVTITVMNNPYQFQTNAINNSSVAYRVELNGKRILFLGDMGVPAGNSFLNEYQNNLQELKADIVQMAHHGEQGVDQNVYEVIRPAITLWCCPEWLWDNDSGSGANSGPWKTLEVRGWMRQLGVKTYVIEKDGDQVLR